MELRWRKFTMKILMGTPTHDSKRYCMKEWLDSVKAMKVPIRNSLDYLIADNSDTESYSAEMHEYCQHIGLRATVTWLQEPMTDKEDEYRRMKSRELVRTELLKKDYDVWLSWECDIIAPPDTLKIMLPYLKTFDSLSLTYPSRTEPMDIVGGIGFTLAKRKLLEKFSFLDGGGYAQCNPDRPGCYYSGDSWFMQRCMAAGHKHAEFINLIAVDHIGERT